MKVVGFSFSKIAAEKIENFQKGKINSHIEFLNIDREKIEFLRESDALRVAFRHSLTYEEENESNKQAELIFEGKIILSLPNDEAKDLLKQWKKNKLPNDFRVPLFNLILKRCASRALQLQEEIGLPSHIPLPRLSGKSQE